MIFEDFLVFVNLVKNQFIYGGIKYAYNSEKEATDQLVDDFGKNYILGVCGKYCLRYKNLNRERDLLKIACYMYILYLKRGFHLNMGGTRFILNTDKKTKEKYFNTFIQDIQKYEFYNIAEYISNAYEILSKLAKESWQKITLQDLSEIFFSCYFEWHFNIIVKGKDEDINNK